jgi:hypothetical protein
VVILFSVGSFSCASYQNEKKVAADASANFYERFSGDGVQSISSELMAADSSPELREAMRKKLELVKTALGKISDKKMVKSDGKSAGGGVIRVSCIFKLTTEKREYFQELVWNVADNSAKISEVLTYSMDDKGQVQPIVIDGKIIF